MPLRICADDPLLRLVRRRFDGLNVLATPSPSMRPFTVVGLQNRRSPLELGGLLEMIEGAPGDPAQLISREELPNLAGEATRHFGLDLAARLLPGLLGAFGGDAAAALQSGRDTSFSLRFQGVHALRVDRAALGRWLQGARLSVEHPHVSLFTEAGVKFAVVDRVILADEVELTLTQRDAAGASARGPVAQGLSEVGGAALAEQQRAQRIVSRAPASVVLAWSCLVYRLDAEGRITGLSAVSEQMDGEDGAPGERAAAWHNTLLGGLRGAEQRAPAPPRLPEVGAVVATTGLLFRTSAWRPQGPVETGPVLDYNPTFDPGSADVKQGSSTVGVTYTSEPSSGVTTEDMLLTRSSGGVGFPNLAPLTGAGDRSAATVATAATGFEDREAFLDDAWDELDPAGGSTTYHVRGAARRYTVNTPSTLASALSGAQGSEWVDKLVERDSQQQVVNTGWIYVEVLAYDGEIHRIVHQFTPSGMAIPPSSNTLSLEPASGSSLSDLVTNHVSSGWRYTVSVVDAVVVSGGPLTADPPTAPSALGSNQGVTAI